MGKVEVVVVEAKKLHDCQLIGMPDPYVRITCENKKYKTPVIENELNPKWNETFRFQISDEMSSQLVMEIWNKCTYDDDLMGRYQLSLGGLTRGVVKDEWYILDKSKTQAELRVRVLAVDFGKEPTPEQAWMVTNDIHRDPVLRAIEDGKWSYGRTTGRPPTPSGPPTTTPTPAPGTAPSAGYPPQPGQAVTTTSVQPPPGTAPGAPVVNVTYAAPAGYPPQPGYGSAYPPPPPQPGFPPQPGYGGSYPPPPQPGYGGSYPPPPQPGYGGSYPPPPQPGFPQQPGFPPQPGFPSQPGYPPQPGYGAGFPPPPQPGYGNVYPPPPQPGYGGYPGAGNVPPRGPYRY